MDAQQLTDLLKDPSRLEARHAVDLQEILRKAPYFAATRVLHAILMLRENMPGNPAELRRAALSVPDRKKLKEVVELFGKTPAPVPVPDHPKAPTPSVPEPVAGIPEPVAPAEEPLRLVFTKEELIEKFIREEPRISAPKAEFFNPSESSLRSNIDDDEIVSETLALLYAEQGNATRAIRIYEKLCLLYPEKSSYFAARISNLSSK